MQITVTPYLCASDAARALDFYARAFGAEESRERIIQPDGRVGHAEFTIGDAHFMIADEFPEIDVRSPQTLGGTPIALHLTVEDADAVAARAEAAGATVVMPVADQPYGRAGKITDPFGHSWMINAPA